MPRQKSPLEPLKNKIPSLAYRPGEEEKRARPWEETNPVYSFRIRPEDAERLAARSGELGLSRDALARALLWAALDAMDAGRLTLDVEEVLTQATDRSGRIRTYARRIATPAWAAGQTVNSGECRGSFDAASNAASAFPIRCA